MVLFLHCSNCASPQPEGSSVNLDIDTDLLNDWQHDYDGLELVEWNNNLSKKLMQYTNASRLLLGRSGVQEFSLLGKSGLGIEFHTDVSYPLACSGINESVGLNTPKTLKAGSLFGKLADLQIEASRSR